MNEDSIENQLKNIDLNKRILNASPSAAPNLDVESGFEIDFPFDYKLKVVLPPRAQSEHFDSRPKLVDSEWSDSEPEEVFPAKKKDGACYDDIKKTTISLNDFNYIQFKQVQVKAEIHQEPKKEVDDENLELFNGIVADAQFKDLEKTFNSQKGKDKKNESTGQTQMDKIDLIETTDLDEYTTQDVNPESDKKDFTEKLEQVPATDSKKFSAFKRFKKNVFILMICGFKKKT
jgi:hypothetical protein